MLPVGEFSGISDLQPRGTRLCQCPLCYEIFSGEATFVLHRIEGDRVGGKPGAYNLTECRDPASKGMILNDAGVWVRPLGAQIAQNVVSTRSVTAATASGVVG